MLPFSKELRFYLYIGITLSDYNIAFGGPPRKMGYWTNLSR